MKKIRLGLLGCGRISTFHLNALKLQHEYYDVVAVADILIERAQKMGATYNAKFYSSLDEMINHENLDLVVLCTPSGLHPSQAKVCADKGVACLSEKPLGCFYDEALEVVTYFENKKIPLFLVHQNRYNPTIQKIKKWFDEGRLGNIFLIQANVFWHRDQAYYDAENWRGKRKLDGGAMMNQASHYVDLLQWFGGDVENVKAEVATLARNIECEDTGAAVIRFKSGAIGVLAVTMLTYPENHEGSLTLLTEHATIKISGKALNQIEVCKVKDQEIMLEENNINYEPATIYGNSHEEYYKRLKGYFFQEAYEAVTGREGLKSLKLLCEIYREQDLVR